jgi:hypothetical protein
MTRKHYRQIAAVIAENRRSESEPARLAVAAVARDMPDMFKWGNPQFRHDRFFATCELDAFGEDKGA